MGPVLNGGFTLQGDLLDKLLDLGRVPRAHLNLFQRHEASRRIVEGHVNRPETALSDARTAPVLAHHALRRRTPRRRLYSRRRSRVVLLVRVRAAVVTRVLPVAPRWRSHHTSRHKILKCQNTRAVYRKRSKKSGFDLFISFFRVYLVLSSSCAAIQQPVQDHIRSDGFVQKGYT